MGFFVTASLVAYILIGYPVLLALTRVVKRPPVAKDPAFRCRVTVVMAVYNGAAFIRNKLDSILALDYPKELMQILVVCDGCTDGTDETAAAYAAYGVELIRIPHSGKAACLNAAFGRATGDLLFFTDVRQLLHARALTELVANFADGTVGAVTGEMQLLPGSSGEHAAMDLYWRYELWARRKHSEIDSVFTTTGCIYALRRELVTELPPDTLSDDAVLSLNAFFKGYRVIVEPSAVAFDYPALSGTEFRRRWRNLAGLWQIHARTPALFTSSNRMRRHFLSHKFGRLVLPWAMLGVLACTAALPSHWRSDLLAGDLLLIALAVFDGWIPRSFPLKRLCAPARAFLLMNAASLAGLAVFFIPARKIWKTTQPALVRETGF
ncbi:MAG: glycosyltransferase family 2 protein [Bryobacterales bacterium]|nr:glycosyltransferase family 2 protein [Bryobacterales bacterium]